MTINLTINLGRLVIGVIAAGSAIAVAVLFLRPTSKAAPEFLNYQGTLTDNTGQPLPNGPVELTFSIYDTAQPGGGEQLVWGPFTAQADVISGRFNVVLGPADETATPRALQEAFQGDGDRFIEIRVDGGAPILPRQQFLSIPYAVRASRADLSDNGIPIGTVIDWWCPDASFPVPEGFILCDGSTINDPDSPLNGKALPDLVGKLVSGAPDVGSVGAGGGSTSLAGNPQNTSTSSNGNHNHRWGSYDAGGFIWRSYRDSGTSVVIHNHSDGLDTGGSGFYSLGRAAGEASFNYYTNMTGHNHDVPLPEFVGLLKILRYK